VIARSASDEAIHASASRKMDCFASLAMTEGAFHVVSDRRVGKATTYTPVRTSEGGSVLTILKHAGGGGHASLCPPYGIYILLRAAVAADASTTLSTSSRQRRISMASTG